MATAVVAGRRERSRPANRVLVPQWGARLFGLAALCTVGALQWQRLVEGLPTGRVLLWVLAAVGSAVAVLLVTAPPRRRWRVGPRVRGFALAGVVLAAMFVGYLLSGLELWYLRPRHWDELLSGLGGGLQALGTVRLPYASADPWPPIVLELLGAQLLILAGLLTFWPRVTIRTGERVPLQVPERGYPFVALAVLIVVIASPIISIGGTRPVVTGLLLAALAVCFLWLERLPLRPGLGVAGLLLVALLGALPVAATADRGQPWFDYRAFAESLGPADPVRFSWAQSYGPITWPRDGNEVMRVVSGEPLYWKARNLDSFDGNAWQVRQDRQDTPQVEQPWQADVPADWEKRPAWTSEIEVFVKRVQTTDVIGAGTIMSISDNSSFVRPGFSPGTWDAPQGLQRNDSYRAQVHVPNPQGDGIEKATTGRDDRQEGTRILNVPFQQGQGIKFPEGAFGSRESAPGARVYFAPFGTMEPSYATYPRNGGQIERSIDEIMQRSKYERTWNLVQRLKRENRTPLDFIRSVDAYLHRAEFRYEEQPPATPAGQEPLDFFINESHLGYCQHYAGAMALMLRMGGISARVATGFSPGGYSASKKAWIVRDTDAHAWVEVWFDQYGWVTVDPTPSATPARSRVASSITAAPVASPTASDSGAEGGDSAAGGAGHQSVRPDLQTGTSSSVSASDQGNSWTWLLWTGGVLAVLGAALGVVLFLRRPRGATPMDRAIAEVEAALRRVGRPVSTGTTLRELERRLGSHSPEVAEYLRALGAGRYAPDFVPPSRGGRRALRRALAQGLGFGGTLRALWAMPPRVERGWPRRPRGSRTLEVDASVRA